MHQPRDDEPDPLQASCALDRLAQEFVDRARRGEGPSIEAYALANPALAADIRALFPVLAVVEGLKEAPAGEVAPSAAARGDGAGPAWIPQRVGAYRILREVGRGGMGSVHEARRDASDDEDDEERVAVKIIHPHLLAEAEYVARFLREAEAGRRVDHPNVVRTLSTGLLDAQGDEVPYLVLEYVEGQNLRALLREVEVVPERLCLHIGARVADALAAVHAAGLVHRDVKPENVVITADEQVKLTDLGVAVLQDRAARLSGTGQFVGSLLYAAPEQLLGEAPDPRWDLYALGVVLFELATGSHPGRERAVGWLRRDAHQRASTSPRAVEPRLSPFFDAVVSTLLAVEPRRRFPSAELLRDAFVDGEGGTWWREHLPRAPPAASRLGPIDRATRFHGRRTEWATLEGAWAAACAGEGRSLLLVGDAGMGKTRLVQEWLDAQEDLGARRVLVVRYGPGGGAGAGGELFTAVRELVGADVSSARLRELLGTLAPLADALARALEGDVALQPGPLSLEAATIRLLGALAAERPLVLVLEDLHFAGPEGQQRFLRLARALQSRPVLLLGTTRPVPPPTWAAELDASPAFVRLDLAGLDASACRDLVLEASGKVALVEDSILRLTRRADRNPFFLLELIREARARPRADPGTATTDTQVPRTIQSLITSRLAALDPTDRELLEAAACCGEEFDPVAVAEAAGVRRIEALKRCGRLDREQQLLRPAGRCYRFRHHLLQEALYAGLHPALRETYHAALGAALEAGSAEPETGVRAVALCRHFLEGGTPDRARPHLRSALECVSWQPFAPDVREGLVRRALEIPGLLVGADRAFALMARGTALESEARHDEARAALLEALAIVPSDDRSGIEEDALRALASVHRDLGRFDDMAATYERAATRARDHGDGPRIAMAMCGLAGALISRGHLDDAETAVRRGFDAIREQPDAYREGRLTSYQAQIEISRGRYDAAMPLLEHAQVLCHGIGDLTTEMMVLSHQANIAADGGRMEASLDFLQRGLEVERQLGHPHLLVNTMSNIAYCLREMGRIDEAVECAGQAHAIATHRDDARQRVSSSLRLGALYVDLGRLVEAERELRYGWELAVARELPQFVAGGAIALTELLALEGREQDAHDVLDQTRGDDAPRWPPRLELKLRATEGGLHERMGRWEEARRVYEGACGPKSSPSAGRRVLDLCLARASLRCGRSEGVEGPLRETLAWARAGGMLRLAVLAEAHLAGLPGGDLLAARVTLERDESALPLADRIEAHHALWRAGGGEAHLHAAGRALDALQAGAPPEHRESLATGVALHREVRAALRDGRRG